MCKILITSAAITALQAIMPIDATAETVKHREYVYSYDDEARGLEDDVFLVCTDCPDGRLHQIYSIAARYSAKPDQGGTAIKAAEPPELQMPSTIPELIPTVRKILGIIRFPFDSSVLSTSSKRQLDGLDFSNRRVRLEGYTCIDGPNGYNKNLSQRRARSVSNYLKSRGVSILDVDGLGESTKFKNKPENRRVEIIDDAKE